jgi:UPF0716 family protein affecting phage T7 exclusion
MKKSATIKEKLTFIGSAIIVLAAFAIMCPGLLTVAAGLGRILLIVAVAGGGCLALAYGMRSLARAKRSDHAVSDSVGNTANNTVGNTSGNTGGSVMGSAVSNTVCQDSDAGYQ